MNLAATFEAERMRRTIDAATDPDDLRKIAHLLLQAWTAQRATTEQMFLQGWLGR